MSLRDGLAAGVGTSSPPSPGDFLKQTAKLINHTPENLYMSYIFICAHVTSAIKLFTKSHLGAGEGDAMESLQYSLQPQRGNQVVLIVLLMENNYMEGRWIKCTQLNLSLRSQSYNTFFFLNKFDHFCHHKYKKQ